MKPHPILFPFSVMYGVIVSLRNLFFDMGLLRSVDIGLPVISVGNITVGGTGKTPIVKNVAGILMEAGKKVAIISRGYGRMTTGTIVVSDGENIVSDANSSGDEPMMLAKSLQNAVVIVDEDRVRGAKKAMDEFKAEVIILDDGFQHRYLQRNKDIVLMDAEHLPFKTMMLPAGYRREPKRSLHRADAIMMTKSVTASETGKIVRQWGVGSSQRIFSSSFTPSGIKHLFGGVKQSLEILKGHTAVVFCGIARPESFMNSLVSCGVIIKETKAFSDHHDFERAEIDAIIESFHHHKADFILTTEKDAVRLQKFESILKDLPVLSLIMDVTVHQKDEWKKYILD